MAEPGEAAGGPLAGVRVIDLTAVVLGPFATQTLGDMGADVVKIETPEGDPTRQIGPSREAGMGSYFANLNRNKRSVVLDLKRPAARAALERLIAGADVFVHNMRLGAAARLGLDDATLGARYPRLIHAAATGFREGSSMAEYPAFDDLIQGMSGAAALNAGPDGAPRYFPTVAVDKLTGQLLASMIGMALFHRERTGQRPGGARADDGVDAVVPAGRAPVGCDDRRAGAGDGLSAHADPAPAALCDARRVRLGHLRERCAMGAAVPRHRAGGAGRRPALRDHRRAVRACRCAVWRCWPRG